MIKWIGAKELQGAFANLAEKSDRELEKVLQTHGANLQQAEMRDVPVDTGFLKRSITLTMDEQEKAAIVEPTADYAAYVEYGTRFAPAQPYVRPNYDQEMEAFISDLKKLAR